MAEPSKNRGPLFIDRRTGPVLTVTRYDLITSGMIAS